MSVLNGVVPLVVGLWVFALAGPASAQSQPFSATGKVARFVSDEGILEVKRVSATTVEFSYPVMDGPGTGRQTRTLTRTGAPVACGNGLMLSFFAGNDKKGEARDAATTAAPTAAQAKAGVLGIVTKWNVIAGSCYTYWELTGPCADPRVEQLKEAHDITIKTEGIPDFVDSFPTGWDAVPDNKQPAGTPPNDSSYPGAFVPFDATPGQNVSGLDVPNLPGVFDGGSLGGFVNRNISIDWNVCDNFSTSASFVLFIYCGPNRPADPCVFRWTWTGSGHCGPSNPPFPKHPVPTGKGGQITKPKPGPAAPPPPPPPAGPKPKPSGGPPPAPTGPSAPTPPKQPFSGTDSNGTKGEGPMPLTSGNSPDKTDADQKEKDESGKADPVGPHSEVKQRDGVKTWPVRPQTTSGNKGGSGKK